MAENQTSLQVASSPILPLLDLEYFIGVAHQEQQINNDMSSPTSSCSSTDTQSCWRELNVSDVRCDSTNQKPPSAEELADRNVKILEHHILHVMNWRRDHRVKLPVPDNSTTGHRHNTSTAKQTERRDIVTGACADNNLKVADKKIAHLPPLAKAELVLFIQQVASRYNKVLYHNFEHASHVTACVHQLILMFKEGNGGNANGGKPTESATSCSSDMTPTSSAVFPNEGCTSQGEGVGEKEVIFSRIPNKADAFMSTNPIVHLSLVFTALIHDIEHQGVGNRQLVCESDPIAIKYEGNSVAENNSFDVSHALLYQEKFTNLRHSMFGEFDLDQVITQLPNDKKELVLKSYQNLFHQITRDVIMATDISCPTRMKNGKSKWRKAFELGSNVQAVTNCKKHKRVSSLSNFSDAKRRKLQSRRQSVPPISKRILHRRNSSPDEWSAPTEFIADPFPDQKKFLKTTNRSVDIEINCEIHCPLCGISSSRDDAFQCTSYTRISCISEQIIQAADVGHLMQSWPVFIKWNIKLYDELWVAKINNRGPDLIDKWFEGQISFFDNYIFPLALRLKQCGIFGSFGDIFYENASLNRKRWMIEGYDLCQQMHDYASKTYGTTKQSSSG
jgi:hypothetical protein